MTSKPKAVKEYLSSKPREVQQRLEELRSYLQLADPKAKEELKWGKPAFTNNGILYVYAGLKKHISLHPTPSVIAAFHEDLKGYTCSENTIQFPLDKPIPKALVIKLAKFRVFEKLEKGIGWK
ncbi:iron chaperone [Gilvimarinus algae]|uniref:DUF1801 domain-containing protein n=1 Tax=Gilvimarinus algae TaxID=3058037 RepID=A0ABT8T8Z1_9GAMM|nr:DUF1801 domain-containing protein [Gilvimarinus sp. SDUM040014]MDO3380602.1 DUF1801 domain-containing protein [Gilvimarinus sp. SDUM040014]